MTFVFDFISLVFYLIQLGLLFLPTIYLFSTCSESNFLVLAFSLPITFFIGLLSVIIFVFIMFRVIGRIEEGTHDFPNSLNAKKWGISLLLKKFTVNSIISQIIFSFSFTRYLYFIACNSPTRVYQMMNAAQLSLQDLNFVHIEKGVMLGMNCMIAPHAVAGKKLHLKKVIIRENAQLHYACIMQGGSELGKSSLLGAKSNLRSGVKVGNNVKVGAYCDIDQKTIIHDDAVIGQKTHIEKNCIIEKGVSIPEFSFIPKGTTVNKENAQSFRK